MSRRLLSALHELQSSGSPASLSIPMHVGGTRLDGNLRDRDQALVDSRCSPPGTATALSCASPPPRLCVYLVAARAPLERRGARGGEAQEEGKDLVRRLRVFPAAARTRRP